MDLWVRHSLAPRGTYWIQKIRRISPTVGLRWVSVGSPSGEPTVLLFSVLLLFSCSCISSSASSLFFSFFLGSLEYFRTLNHCEVGLDLGCGLAVVCGISTMVATGNFLRLSNKSAGDSETPQMLKPKGDRRFEVGSAVQQISLIVKKNAHIV